MGFSHKYLSIPYLIHRLTPGTLPDRVYKQFWVLDSWDKAAQLVHV